MIATSGVYVSIMHFTVSYAMDGTDYQVELADLMNGYYYTYRKEEKHCKSHRRSNNCNQRCPY